ncbi:MAG TPA: hypothetical protein VGJ07_24040 [Rugosimonospora sp.]|jgi:hypothetical protein
MSSHDPRVIFYRGPGRWYQRTYGVKLDGAIVARLRRGETRSVPIQPGYHVAQAYLPNAAAGSRKLEFEALPGAAIRIRVDYAGHFLVGLWRAFTFTRWLRLVVESEGVEHHTQPGAFATAARRRRSPSRRGNRSANGPVRPF